MLFILHARLRVRWAPGIPHALVRARDSWTARAHCAARPRRRVCGLSDATHAQLGINVRRGFAICRLPAMEAACLRGAPSALAARLPPEFRLSARPGSPKFIPNESRFSAL